MHPDHVIKPIITFQHFLFVFIIPFTCSSQNGCAENSSEEGDDPTHTLRHRILELEIGNDIEALRRDPALHHDSDDNSSESGFSEQDAEKGSSGNSSSASASSTPSSAGCDMEDDGSNACFGSARATAVSNGLDAEATAVPNGFDTENTASNGHLSEESSSSSSHVTKGCDLNNAKTDFSGQNGRIVTADVHSGKRIEDDSSTKL